MAYDVKTVKRQWEGHETERKWGRYPVEHEPIRRHCHMVGDANPLFIEEGRCPPVMVDLFAPRGRVKQKGPDGTVEVEVWIASAQKGITVPGSATVILPARR